MYLKYIERRENFIYKDPEHSFVRHLNLTRPMQIERVFILFLGKHSLAKFLMNADIWAVVRESDREQFFSCVVIIVREKAVIYFLQLNREEYL